jgi:hypothetical protein
MIRIFVISIIALNGSMIANELRRIWKETPCSNPACSLKGHDLSGCRNPGAPDYETALCVSEVRSVSICIELRKDWPTVITLNGKFRRV